MVWREGTRQILTILAHLFIRCALVQRIVQCVCEPIASTGSNTDSQANLLKERWGGGDKFLQIMESTSLKYFFFFIPTTHIFWFVLQHELDLRDCRGSLAKEVRTSSWKSQLKRIFPSSQKINSVITHISVQHLRVRATARWLATVLLTVS